MARWLLPAAALVATALTVSTVAACSSSGGTPAGSTTSVATTPAPATTATTAPVSSRSPRPSLTVTRTASPPPRTRTARPSHSRSHRPTGTPRPTTYSPPPPPTSSSPQPTTAPPPNGPQPCTAGQLHASGVRGGAYQGQEIAGVLFANSSHTTCTMQGYVFARLRYHHAMLGKPATHDPGPQRLVTLHPGATAEVQLTAISTCQAPISDHVLVRVPGDRTAIVVGMQLRGCALSVGPITPT